MNKLDYFLKAVENKFYLRRAWVLSSFSVSRPKKRPKVAVGHYYDEGKLFTLNDEPITDFKDLTPLFTIDEKVIMPKGSFPGVNKDTPTTYGIWLMNLIFFFYPYEEKAVYVNGPLDDTTVNKIAYDNFHEDKVTLKAHKRFENACSFISAFSQLAVPSSTRKSASPNPEAIKLKNKLVAEHAGELTDPNVLAKIQEELIQEDYRYLAGDRSLGFLNKKSMRVVRPRTFSMYGSEPDFEDETKINVVTASLAEGWGADDIGVLANVTRNGSYSRGASTALAGAEVKVTGRVFQNYTLGSGDCGTVVGMRVRIDSNNKDFFAGQYLVGSSKPIAVGELKNKLGTWILLRGPGDCAEKGTAICKKCAGKTISEGGLGLGAMVLTGTSAFLAFFMAAMHTVELTTAEYDFNDRIT